ncbi:hypothetical protein MLP_07470 [Microlunatus phosphovorus NM-1]|uniref:Uncharacterized protein n=1 Tax=Microlunatus phosphovorus (strain ATCC 700054 / DSM 10555 / JCM 9379 / NBRC 101784 / NCIMB 13414 / VKM Ac-1990 / NM-1) TaxID=1032480 RepID=F5XL73_MICPN|nr:hypothetical protein [Microlunatus phosphovorus]BAK33761.1 hypothetical protein MLP_07470 [Microlunatus phosphovorus NM-1]
MATRRKKKAGKPRLTPDERAAAKALAADVRGRRVKPTLKDYERVAKIGQDRVVEALISRHNLRMSRVSSLPASYRSEVMTITVPLSMVDTALSRMGANPKKHPNDYSGEAADHYAWATSSIVSAVRLMLVGQVVGAAAVTRHLLERWTLHRAYNWKIVKDPGEAQLDYFARVWSTPQQLGPMIAPPVGYSIDEGLPGDNEVITTDHEEPSPDHLHVELSDGREICPAVVYSYLSEVLHAREFTDAIAWDAGPLLETPSSFPPQAFACASLIGDGLALCMRQIRLATMTLAQERRDQSTKSALGALKDTYSEPSEAEVRADKERDPIDKAFVGSNKYELATPPLAALIPLLPEEGLSQGALRALQNEAFKYEQLLKGFRPAGRLYRDDEFTSIYFCWKRLRSARWAISALDDERALLGDEFNLDSLSGRATKWVVVTEIASLASMWIETSEASSALALCGTGTRSAYWLWLEDDDRAMAVLRCVLEQVARARAWRLKPEKARRLEDRPQTRPRDWLELAGWRRLTPLNKALGEFAHTLRDSRWGGARLLLADLQVDADPDRAPYTARGGALELVLALLAMESHSWIAGLSENLASTLGEVFDSMGLMLDTATIDQTLNHIWTHREADLGPPTFTQMPSA